MPSTAHSPHSVPPTEDLLGHGAHAALPGVRLWYTDTGGEGVPLVLLHANTGTVQSWQHQVGPFAQAGYRVIALDRRGWGRSMADPATGPQPGSVAEDLHALVGHLRLPRFHLLGIAGGGFVALDYAAWQPGHLRSLLVCASNGQFQEPEMAAFSQRIDAPGMGEPERRVYREVGPAYRAADLEGLARFVAIEHAARQPGAPAQPMRTPNTFAKIAAITLPTLVMTGGADMLAPPALMRAWARHLRNAQYVHVPDAGHSIHWEQPEAFNGHVLRFLQAQPR